LGHLGDPPRDACLLAQLTSGGTDLTHRYRGGGRIKTVKEGTASTRVNSLGERLRIVENEVAEIRAALARVEAERLPPLTKLASKRAGRPVSEDEMRDRARRRPDEILSRIQQAAE
jgi:hypothetical protein